MDSLLLKFATGLIFNLVFFHTGFTQDLETAIDNYLSPVVEGNNFSGSILAAQNGEIIINKGYGSANVEFGIENTPQTKFHIASLSKGFTAASILILEVKGLINLDDPVTKYIPELENFGNVTIHHLLSHYSGIPDINRQSFYKDLSRNNQTPTTLTEVIKEFELQFEPGEKYSYSNSNYNLLAKIIEIVSGQDYGTFLRNQILDPLGLKNTGHHWHMEQIIKNSAVGYIPGGGGYRSLEKAPYLDWSVKTGNGSIYSTTEDLYMWVSGLIDGKVAGGETWKQMTDNKYAWFAGEKVGERVIYYNGNSPGFSSFIGYFPEKDFLVIVLGNNHIPLATAIGEGIAGLQLNKEIEEFEVLTPVSIEKESVKSIAGVYKFPFFTVELAEKNGSLIYTGGYPGYDITMIPLSENEFFNRFFWNSLFFEKDNTGKVTHAYWEYNPEQKGRKIEK